MRIRRCAAVSLCALVLALAAPAATARAGAILLTPPGIGAPSEVSNVLADGSVVAVGDRFRYDASGVTTFPPDWCRINSVSDDGVVMVGAFCVGLQEIGFRWNWETSEVVDLSAAVGTNAVATDVSADGSVVVGRAASPVNQAFRWTPDTGAELLGDLTPSVLSSAANGVSADGLVVVGKGTALFGPTGVRRGFRWEDGVMQAFGVLAGTNDSESEATVASADGSVVVGVSAGGYEAGQPFRWTADTGMQPLGTLAGGTPEQVTAQDLSGDGRIIVGRAYGPNGHEAAIWDPEFGLRPLRGVLQHEFDLDLSRYTKLEYASAISTDGRVIGGRGEQPDRSLDGWIAVLPHPPSQFGCNVELNDDIYTDGDTVQITTLRYANRGPSPLGTRLRLQLELPIPVTIQVLDLGADGSFAIPSGLNVDLAPVTMFTVQAGQPRGDFALRCALEDAATGRVQAEDRVPFQLQ